MEGMSNVFEEAGHPAGEPEPEAEPRSITEHRYRRWDQSSVVVCDDCGCLVFDTGRHDNFHLMVESR